MNSHFTSRTPKLGVVSLSNSLAIPCNSRLDFECSESQPASSRLIQSFSKRKLATLRVAKVLRKGGLLAHQTGTVAGIAAHPSCPVAVKKLQRFKQRKGPFLLLADSISTALSQARYISPALRKLAKASWPGAVTLVFPAKPKHDKACYQQGAIAVRVDSDLESRRLAQLCGGLLLSSSLNRCGKPTMPLNRQLFRRFSSWIDVQLPYEGRVTLNTPSRIYHIAHSSIKRLR